MHSPYTQITSIIYSVHLLSLFNQYLPSGLSGMPLEAKWRFKKNFPSALIKKKRLMSAGKKKIPQRFF